MPDASGPFVGAVTLNWAPTSVAVTANFTTPTSATAPDAGCPGAQLGSCCVYSQPALTSGATEPITVGAGVISIADGSAALGSFDFSGIGYVPLSSAETQTLFWNPGDALAVSAAGAQVAGFAGEVTVPAAFANVTPVLTTTAQVVVRLSDGFTATWSPPAGATGTVTLELFDPVGFYVDCVGPDAAGTLSVSAAALASIPKGDMGDVTLSRSNSVALTSANASVTLVAQTTDVGLVTFQ